MNPIKIGPIGEFSFGGENFMIEGEMPPKDRRPSSRLRGLASGFLPRSILELGIFQGGSYVFLDKLFKPRRISHR